MWVLKSNSSFKADRNNQHTFHLGVSTRLSESTVQGTQIQPPAPVSFSVTCRVINPSRKKDVKVSPCKTWHECISHHWDNWKLKLSSSLAVLLFMKIVILMLDTLRDKQKCFPLGRGFVWSLAQCGARWVWYPLVWWIASLCHAQTYQDSLKC